MLSDEELTPEEFDLRQKGLALVARIEWLYAHDEGFRRWFDEGYEEIAQGHYFQVYFDGERLHWPDEE